MAQKRSKPRGRIPSDFQASDRSSEKYADEISSMSENSRSSTRGGFFATNKYMLAAIAFCLMVSAALLTSQHKTIESLKDRLEFQEEINMQLKEAEQRINMELKEAEQKLISICKDSSLSDKQCAKYR
jgi:hypothetical protein